MRATLEDIVSRLRQGNYKNEEHVRVAIVCRLLSKLGWDIWNPIEVNTEFPAIRSEDASRVDVALFMPPQLLRPAVFIEVKAVGKLAGSIEAAERQLRDYNRNNQAEISILTDGRLWRFYIASAPGEFSQKCFEKLDLLDDTSALDDVELTLDAFLSKTALQSGKAVVEAFVYLKRTDVQRIMFEVLPASQRDAEDNPARSLVECFITRCSERGVECSKEEALNFLHNTRHPQSPSPARVIKEPVISSASTEKRRIEPAPTETVLRIQSRRGTNASGKNLLSGKFVVFKGSLAAEATPGFKSDARGYYPLYSNLIDSKVLMHEESDGLHVYRLTRDFEFPSSSAAASVFMGTSASGPREWK